ncbi:hypothetical protein ACFL2Z_02290 [Candidatus Eisenbacteria bacterium]|uniref:Outer membrane protein beta-barrel domain-containing protein n=1 Tax=Eiseniibacteriota bacterium TaxID=2212470 RepID=A0ABV6YNT5_UNCEI
MQITHSTYRIALALMVIAGLAGCHSAMFQTARIRDGMEASAGVTRAHGGDSTDVSDYSIYMRGEMGYAASESKFGYSFALSFVSPFKNRGSYKYGSGELEWNDSGSLPNEFASVLPELKLQFPRKIPVDFALDARFSGIYPERAAVIASADLASWLTPYASYALNYPEGQLLCLGSELILGDNVALLIEGTRWLSEHEYPDDYYAPVHKYPYSFGLTMSYRFPRKSDSRKHAPRDLAFHNLGSGRD